MASHDQKPWFAWIWTLLTAFIGTFLGGSLKTNEAHSMGPEIAEAREGLPTGETHTPSAAELKARGRRNVAIALAVAGFVVLVYLTTFFRLAENLQAAGA